MLGSIRMLVEFVVLLLPRGSREYLLMQDYGTVETLYFVRDPRVQWSKWHKWWYDNVGNNCLPVEALEHVATPPHTVGADQLAEDAVPTRAVRCVQFCTCPASSVQGPRSQHCKTGRDGRRGSQGRRPGQVGLLLVG